MRRVDSFHCAWAGWPASLPVKRRSVRGITRRCIGRSLLRNEQVPSGGGAGGEGLAAVALGIREGLQREAVAVREQVGDDRLRLETQLQHALALLGVEYLGHVRARPLEQLADLALDVGVAATGAEQLVEKQEETRFVLDHVGKAGDEDVEDVVDRLR